MSTRTTRRAHAREQGPAAIGWLGLAAATTLAAAALLWPAGAAHASAGALAEGRDFVVLPGEVGVNAKRPLAVPPRAFQWPGSQVVALRGTFKEQPVTVIFDFGGPPTFNALVPAGNPEAGGTATSASRDGSCVVGHQDSGFFTRSHAFRWTQASGAVDLGTLDAASNADRSSSASDASSDCSVVVGTSHLTGDGFVQHAFRWTQAGGMADLGAPAGAARSSRAFGVSGDGAVVVGDAEFADSNSFTGFRTGAFRWTAAGGGTFQDLGSLAAGFPSVATAVSADGTVVVGQGGVEVRVGNASSNGSRAFRWTESQGMQPIGPAPGELHSAATGVSDNGKVVVGTSAPGPLTLGDLELAGGGAFRWTEATGLQDLRQLLVDAGADMTGITLVAVTGVSPDGQWIAGKAITPQTEQGATSAFIVQYCDDAIGGPCFSAGTPGTPSFSVGASSTALSVAAGQSTTTDITVTPNAGFTQAVSFTCAGLPAGATCSFSPASVTPAGGPATTTLTITTDGTALAWWPALPGAVAFASFALLGAGTRRRRPRGRRLRGLWAGWLAALVFGSLEACGGGGGDASAPPAGNNPPPPAATGTPAGISTVTVTASSGSGAAAVSQSLPITLTVTR